MSDKDPAQNWQLENSGKTEDQWQLRAAEQSVLDQLQLQPADESSPEWQPVDYVRPPRSSRRWILPSVVTVMLLAVVGYMLWIGLGSLLGPGPIGSETATPPPGDAAAPSPAAAEAVPAVAVQPTPTPLIEEPTPLPTEEPPTATPSPLPLVEQEFATVNSQYGVNARSQPTTDAPVIALLENNTKHLVLTKQGDWIEVFVADGELSLSQPISGTAGWAAAEFMTLSTELVDPALPLAVLRALGREPAEPAPAAVAETPIAPTEPTAQPAGEAVAPSLTVSSTTGLNIREQPSVDSAIVRLLENGATAPVIGVSDDGLWYQVRLDDGVLGWASGDFVVITGDLELLQTLTAPEGAELLPPEQETAPVTATETLSEPVTSSPAPEVSPVEGATATVTRLLPVYPTPDSAQERVSVLLSGATVQVAGRSGDGGFVQVLLPTGGAAWAPISGVELNVDLDALPVTDGS